MINNWTEIKKYLETQKIDPELVSELKDFRTSYEVDDQVKERVAKPDILFYGKKILEMSMAALLQEIICCFPVLKPQEKMCFARHCHGCSADRNTIFLFMLIPTAPIS